MLAEVGEAIIDYLKYSRKRSDSDRIFIYARAPFFPMENSAVSAAISQVVEACGVNLALSHCELNGFSLSWMVSSYL